MKDEDGDNGRCTAPPAAVIGAQQVLAMGMAGSACSHASYNAGQSYRTSG
jgi:hypothetical protein